jgi:hypothetical protein
MRGAILPVPQYIFMVRSSTHLYLYLYHEGGSYSALYCRLIGLWCCFSVAASMSLTFLHIYYTLRLFAIETCVHDVFICIVALSCITHS